jgi:hypothetical protein
MLIDILYIYTWIYVYIYIFINYMIFLCCYNRVDESTINMGGFFTSVDWGALYTHMGNYGATFLGDDNPASFLTHSMKHRAEV